MEAKADMEKAGQGRKYEALDCGNPCNRHTAGILPDFKHRSFSPRLRYFLCVTYTTISVVGCLSSLCSDIVFVLLMVLPVVGVEFLC